MRFKAGEFYGIKTYPGDRLGRGIQDTPWCRCRQNQTYFTASVGKDVYFLEDGKFFRSDLVPTLYEINSKRILRYLYSEA
jgi:hypothetical protein